MLSPSIDALTADRNAHRGPSQVDPTPIPLLDGAPISLTLAHAFEQAPLTEPALRLTLHPRPGHDVHLGLLGPFQAVAVMDRLTAFLRPAPAGGMADATPYPWWDVLQEARRQVYVLGYTAEHDDTHTQGELASAAACYALTGMLSPEERAKRDALDVPDVWPFDAEDWNPATARQDLVRAGAFILAEIGRLDRLAQRSAA